MTVEFGCRGAPSLQTPRKTRRAALSGAGRRHAIDQIHQRIIWHVLPCKKLPGLPSCPAAIEQLLAGALAAV